MSDRTTDDPREIHDRIIGSTVSLDISTGDHNAFDRLFGTVTGTMVSSGGLTILAELTEDNRSQHPEIAVMDRALADLQTLDPDAQLRALSWLSERLASDLESRS